MFFYIFSIHSQIPTIVRFIFLPAIYYITIFRICVYIMFKPDATGNVLSMHKEKSHKHWVYGTFHILYYLKNSKLANTLSKHSICNFFEAGNVCTCNIVSFLSITFGSVIDIVVDIYHDAL